MSTIWAFDSTKNKHSIYRGEYSMKNFCEYLRENAKNITLKKKFEKKWYP